MCKADCISCVVPVSVVTAAATNDIPHTARITDGHPTHVWIRVASGTQKDIQGRTLAASGVIKTGHLTLVDSNGTKRMEIPLESLQRDFNSPAPLCIDGLSVDCTQSKVSVDTSASGYNAAHAVELLFAVRCQGPNCQ